MGQDVMAAARKAISFLTSTSAAAAGKSPGSSRVQVQIQCRIKANAARTREGITAVTADAIEVAVAAPPKDGEANRGVLRVLGQALGVPVSDLTIVRGLKSRDKIVVVDLREVAKDVAGLGAGGVSGQGVNGNGEGEVWVEKVRKKLVDKAERV